MPSVLPATSTGLTITNPLVLYRALLATKRIAPDPAQHRLALHLQKIYYRLKDYEPTVEYSARLKQIHRAVGEPRNSGEAPTAIAQKDDVGTGVFSALLAQKEKRDALALTRVMTSHEAALNLDSPRGLLLYGEVGTGKSMLVDLLADCLPNKKKRRWHFNTFMLETFGRLEQLRRNQQAGDEEYSLLRLARDMISTSPIMFLDEFQLPDRAASKILLNLLTFFFHLGGVLIATSNRMPEELARASGIEFAPPPSQLGLLGRSWRWTGSSNAGPSGGFFGGKAEIAGFLEVLKARCEVWDMEGGRDWRRRDAGDELPLEGSGVLKDLKTGYPGMESDASEDHLSTGASGKGIPDNYFTQPAADTAAIARQKQEWDAVVLAATDSISTVPWQATSMRVYGRTVRIPRASNGTCLWTFDELCATNLGPADYITLASTFHTVVLTDVPVLTLSHKNEARRLITLLDALYEARCRLLMSAAAGPDDLFFPEATRPSSPTATSASANADSDAIYAETVAEVHQDAIAPFRPNVAAYEPSSPHRSVLADEDADFNPRTTVPGAGNEIGRTLDFSATTAFTGEDERFAYKRARSRLWEMCGRRWWSQAADAGFWRPLAPEQRAWELGVSPTITAPTKVDAEGEEQRFPHGASPFRVSPDPPPRFGAMHAWGVVRWGRRAGRWGRGVEALREEKRE
ncbi:MAG: hypothetical protein M1832_002995 [Thelocarpon impressellum]|nr:MAG: hypothetical protein M1832_002995 [Thelocarpon impressellum]